MNFTFYIAKRYLFSKKKQNIINIISGISMVAVAIGTAAMIIVLSVFNGFEHIGYSFLSSFNPPIRIEAKSGKYFDSKKIDLEKIRNIEGVSGCIEAFEDNALLRYDNNQLIVTVKGVDDSFLSLSNLDTSMVRGNYKLTQSNSNFAILGASIAHSLGINFKDYTNHLTIFLPNRDANINTNLEESFIEKKIYAGGAFAVMPDIDYKYVIVPIRFLKPYLKYPTEVSSIDIYLTPKADIKKIQKEIYKITDESFSIKNRFEQQELYYKTVKSEKLAIYIILSFILLIACFNATGSLSMLILEKTKDIQILKSLGLNITQIRRIFLTEGLLISIIGGLAGLVLGFIICFIQQTFGIIQLDNAAEGNFIISAFPVYLKITDFLMVGATVFGIGWLSVILPCSKIKNNTTTK